MPVNARRNVLIALGAIAMSRPVLGQEKKPPVLIALLDNGTRSERNLAAFKEGMAALGWKEGATDVLDVRWSQGARERLPSLAAELAAKRPAIFVTITGSATIAASKAAPQTPIVQANGSSPVGLGLATSLA